MPWIPKTDFEEEVVNLQPHYDFIYGVLSEPQFSYPRPKSHTEYAASKNLQDKQKKKECERTGQINEKLHIIQQVQRMAGTKPLGEQPSVDDWENNDNIEQEIIGMMRHCGLSASVDQPLNPNVTIATFPVENTIKVVKNGRRNVALFFDENVFKLQEKVSDTSSGSESCNNCDLNNSENSANESSSVSALEGSTSHDTSSFNTAGDTSYSSSCVSSCIKSPSQYSHEKRLMQYNKLLEDTSLISLDSSNSRNVNGKQSSDSFQTADEGLCWKPVFESDEDIFRKKENWPSLSKQNEKCETNSPDINGVFNRSQKDSSDIISNEANCSKHRKRVNFLDRFIKSEVDDKLKDTSSDYSSSTSSHESKTYAAITKTPKVEPKPSKNKQKESSNLPADFLPYYTARRMYALKRNVK